MSALDISEVSKRSGVPASTLRYYEEKGLIRSVGRHGLKRIFDADIIDRLSLIALGQAAGFSLDEIGLMLAPEGAPQIDRQALLDKAEELDRTIRKLTTMRRSLLHAANCGAPSHMECPTFLRLVRAAGTGAYKSAAKEGRGKLNA